jgi:two-component system, NarL family, invasion response regulator UvrY
VEAAPPIRVLVVEDNDTFRETLRLLFELRPEISVVASVGTGDEAPTACREHEPDVVLMDYRMPGMNGAEATRAVLSASPSAKVVCLTASVTERELAELTSAGVVRCVTKDAGFDEIVDAVRAAAEARV